MRETAGAIAEGIAGEQFPGEPEPVDLALLRARVESANHILLALDFDGTLAPITNRPEDAFVPPETASALVRLAASPGITVAILSGRSMGDLSSKVGPEFILAGNHGLEIEGGGLQFAHDRARSLEPALENFCCRIAEMLDGIPGAWVERKGPTASVHFRQAPPELAGWIEATVRLVLRAYALCLRARAGRMVWEILPRVRWDKGKALDFIASHLGKPEPLVVCIGDDLTDEDMFRARSAAISIRVGTGQESAEQYSVDDPGEVVTVLEAVLAARGRAVTGRPLAPSG
jgi:trehalose 6-phosphate phosphatase